MKKVIFSLLSLTIYFSTTFGQCTNSLLSKTNWTVHSVNSEETVGEGGDNGHAVHAIDDNPATFWHTQWKDAQPDYPHEIAINLGDGYDVSGVTVLSRMDNEHGKPKEFEIYLSQDGTNWDSPQAAGDFQYPNLNEGGQSASVYFGAVKAKFVRLIFNSSYDDKYYSVLSEIDVYESIDCPATGQINQIGQFASISKKYTTDVPFQLNASISTGLPISYEVVSGPASVSGDILMLDGTAGTVVIKAKQEGDNTYYSWEMTQSFEVVDLNTFYPDISVRFSEVESLRMAFLLPYLLYANATIEESEMLSIVSLEYEINGSTYTAKFANNVYQYWWKPYQFGENIIKVRATASNGNTTEETYVITVTKEVETTVAQTFKDGVIDWGTIGSQWYYGEYDLPQFVGTFDQIIADFSISCPSVPGGCDDWDRLGWVEVQAPNGDWMEVFRYITPYGVPCNASIDVTDYASILQGKVKFRMYIETWGSGGWKLNLKLNYNKGVPRYLYSSVEEIWQGDFSFGNPANLQPVDTAVIRFESVIDSALIRLVSTGHGWGANNTGNAAEFYHAKHHIKVNDVQTFEQDLWQNCNPNPDNCTGQFGTWQHNRAGWCPGSMGMVFSYDMKPYISPDAISLSYIFQENYQDLCHPNHPDCISGVTCADCNDGYNPYYRVGAYLIKYSNQKYMLDVAENKNDNSINVAVYPNPTKNGFRLNVKEHWTNMVVSLLDISGKVIKTAYFNTEKELNSRS